MTASGQKSFRGRRNSVISAVKPRLECLEDRCLLSGGNLAPNPYAIGSTGWSLSDGARYTTYTTHDSNPSSGAWNISTPGAHVRSDFIAITPGQEYTYSAFLKETAFPAFGQMYVAVYDAGKNFLYNLEGSYEATSAANSWQETAIQYTAQPGEAYVILNYKRLPAGVGPKDAGSMWLDDVYFGAGTYFRQPAPVQHGFAGSLVQVDSQGNFQVLRNEVWQPFYVFGVYRGGTANTVQDYSNQGFNTLESNMFSLSLLQQAKDAVSSFNPDGMMSVIDIEQYIDPRSSLYNNLDDLKSNLIALENSPLIDRVLCFYWDNEQYTSYSVAQSVINLVKQYDADATGVRRHPILMNNGNQGTDRAYAGMVDMVGDYIRDPQTASYLGPSQSILERATIIRDIAGQTVPYTVGVISEEAYAVNLRRLGYENLIAGGHGFAYFRDGAHYQYNGDPNSPAANNIALRDCWPEFPKLRSEIDDLMPLLATPVTTTWTASPSSSAIVVGTRTYNGEGYLILVNTTSSALTVQFTLSGLGYSPSALIDYFSGATITAISGYSFTITLSANATGVFRLAKPVTAAAPLTLAPNSSPSPTSPLPSPQTSDGYIIHPGTQTQVSSTSSAPPQATAASPPSRNAGRPGVARGGRRTRPDAWEELEYLLVGTSLR
jgi:hypothetical protein